MSTFAALLDIVFVDVLRHLLLEHVGGKQQLVLIDRYKSLLRSRKHFDSHICSGQFHYLAYGRYKWKSWKSRSMIIIFLIIFMYKLFCSFYVFNSRKHFSWGCFFFLKNGCGYLLEYNRMIKTNDYVIGGFDKCLGKEWLKISKDTKYYLFQIITAVNVFFSLPKCSGYIGKQLNVCKFVKFSHAIPIHLESTVVLSLLHVYVCYVNPHVRKFSNWFTNLRKNISCI